MLIVPLTSESPLYLQRTPLDGVDFLLTLAWNEREERWYMDVADQEGDMIVSSVKLVAGWPVLWRLADDRRPAGTLMLLDLAAIDNDRQLMIDPYLESLGARHVLAYFPAEAE